MSGTPVSYHDFVKKLFNKSDDQSKNFAHAILGIVTEIHEYLSATDEVNGLEELGDIAFYVEALGQLVEEVTGVTAIQTDPDGLMRLFEQCEREGAGNVISGLCNTLLDDAKRWIGYGRQPRSLNEVFCTCRDLTNLVNFTGPYPCMDLDRIIETNRKKLLHRYQGDTFDANLAVNRDLEGERGVLQAS